MQEVVKILEHTVLLIIFMAERDTQPLLGVNMSNILLSTFPIHQYSDHH